MINQEDLQSITEYLQDINSTLQLFYDSTIKINNQLTHSLLKDQTELLVSNTQQSINQLQTYYDNFSDHIISSSKQFIQNIKTIENNLHSNIQQLQSTIQDVNNTIVNKQQTFNQFHFKTIHEPHFIYNNNQLSNGLNVQLVMKFPGSYLYQQYISNNRTNDGNIFIDLENNYDSFIVKYMNNDPSLEQDLHSMNNQTKVSFMKQLSWLQLPILEQFISSLFFNEQDEKNLKKIDAWNNRRIIMINGKNNQKMNKLFKKYHLFQTIFNNQQIKQIHYFDDTNIFYTNINLKYADVIENYLENNKHSFNKYLLEQYELNGTALELIQELNSIGIQLNEQDISQLANHLFYPSSMFQNTTIIGKQYDSYLQEWTQQNHWKLLYRASEHNFSSTSFHQYCDPINEPTLTIIKTKDGYIFGGYTTQSWNNSIFFIVEFFIDIEYYKIDNSAFIFTLKNPHDIAPTRFMKKIEAFAPIESDPNYGPIFGNQNDGYDILIDNNCNNKNSNYIKNDGKRSYDCHPILKKSFFTNTNSSSNTNSFIVSEYEVFFHSKE